MRSSRSSPQSAGGFNSNSNVDIIEEISPEDAAGIELDNEIASLQQQSEYYTIPPT